MSNTQNNDTKVNSVAKTTLATLPIFTLLFGVFIGIFLQDKFKLMK